MIDVIVWLAAKEDQTADGKMIGWLAKESIWVVDVPCVVGVLFVMFLHHCLHKWMPQNEYFAHGLSAGAIAFHVAITQAAFAVLKTRELIESRSGVPDRLKLSLTAGTIREPRPADGIAFPGGH